MKKRRIKRKNHKAFTMIELLTTIVILGILSVIAIVAVSRLISKARNDQISHHEKTAIMATQSYIQTNKDKAPQEIGEFKRIKLSDLKDANFLKENIKNSYGEDCMKESFVRVYKYSKTEYSYTAYIYCGDEVAPLIDEPTVPTVKIEFKGVKNESGNLQNVSNAKLSIEITGGKNGTEKILLDGYSYSLSVKTSDDPTLREVYNSGTQSANRKEKILIEKNITDYIDITNITYVKARVVARNVAGGMKEKEDSASDPNSNDSFYDTTQPTCISIQGASNGTWINASSSTQRSIKATCNDGDGSGCIREKFTKSWPSSDINSDAEYAYIQVQDNAGNKNVEDNYISNPCDITENIANSCRVRVNVDKTYPGIKIEAYKLNSSGKTSGTNMFNSGVNVSIGNKSTKDEVTISYNSYKDLVNGWMNKNNYSYGVGYKVTITDNIHLASWKWETNTPKAEDRNSNAFKNVRTTSNNENDSYTFPEVDMTKNNCGQRSKEITVYFKEEGMRKGRLTVTDKAGNSTIYYIEAYIDRTKPTCSITKSGTIGNNGWYKEKNVSLSMTKSDTGSSKLSKYGLIASTTVSYNSKIKGTQGNTTGITWYGYVIDNAGNTGSCNSGSFKVDKTPPTCSVKKSGTTGSSGWYKEKKVTLTLTKSDTGGSKLKDYGLSNSSTVTYNSETSGTQGNTKGITWYGFVRDTAGNTNKCNSGKFKVDATKPSCSVGSYGNQCKTSGVSCKVTCQDGFSGLNKCAGASSSPVSKSGLKSNQTYTVTDNAGNSNTCTANVSSQTQSRYRTRSSWCKSCSAAGCQSYVEGDVYYMSWKLDGSGEPACPSGYKKSGLSYRCDMDDATTGKMVKAKCKKCVEQKCTSYNASCSACGTAYGNWRAYTGWSNSGCSGSDTKQCDFRTLYKHSGTC